MLHDLEIPMSRNQQLLDWLINYINPPGTESNDMMGILCSFQKVIKVLFDAIIICYSTLS